MLYAAAPRRLAFLWADALRGGTVTEHLADLAAWAAAPGIEDREEDLDRILRHAAATTPFYDGCDPDRGLAGFPVVDRTVLRARFDDFRSRSHAGERLRSVSTSGSSGSPLTWHITRDKRSRQIAEYVFFSRWGGFDLGQRHAHFRARDKPFLKRFAQNQVVMNPTRLSEENLERWRAIFRRGRITCVIGHPNGLEALAAHCQRAGDGPADFAGLAGIITIGETLLPRTRERVREVFGHDPLSRYASAELGVLAHEPPGVERHMVNSASYHVEVLAMDGDRPVPPGALGRVVVTDRRARAMPLIRYDLGDLAVLSTQRDEHGVRMLDRIDGRDTEIVVATDGTLVSPFAFGYFMRTFRSLETFQFVQEGPGRYRMKLVTLPEFDREPELRAGLLEIVGADADLTIEYPESLPVPPSGKRPYVVQAWEAGTPPQGASPAS